MLAHNDLAPWNLIAGPKWTFIDWDLVAPGRRDWDLALALHTFVGLWPGTGPPPVTVRRINAFCDGANVPVSSRGGLLRVVVERTQHNADLIVRRAALGETTFQRLLDEGHATSWSQASAWVAENLDVWDELMARR